MGLFHFRDCYESGFVDLDLHGPTYPLTSVPDETGGFQFSHVCNDRLAVLAGDFRQVFNRWHDAPGLVVGALTQGHQRKLDAGALTFLLEGPCECFATHFIVTTFQPPPSFFGSGKATLMTNGNRSDATFILTLASSEKT